jgi:very-short-patch-repair endonuclease
MKFINLKTTRDNRIKLREKQTDAERKLWSRLRNKRFLELKFYRQTGIGGYIADFYCPTHLLVIEVDGGQHFVEYSKVYDQKRTEFFADLNIRVLRFTNFNVLTNIDGVMECIRCFIEEPMNVVPLD